MDNNNEPNEVQLSESDRKVMSKITGSIVIIIILSLCLGITSFALYTSVRVDGNTFSTGNVTINLNDGEPVIYEHEFLFEPGMTVVKDFFIESLSSDDVYYKLYFDDAEGSLAPVLQITIKDGEKMLYAGTAATLSRTNVIAADDILAPGERRDLTIIFHFPPESGNEVQDTTLNFTMCAEAVQVRNNPNRQFE